MRLNYLAGAGGSVRLAGRALGRGGEGQVLPVAGTDALAAKIFHQPTTERWRKLALMLANLGPATMGHPAVAWPCDLLFTQETKPQFVGYLMPRLNAARPVFAYYTPDVRLARCPGFDYRYLVRAARNLAAAVGEAHARGCVIGDLNESNVLVREDATACLIDVDSWQVRDSARGLLYRCPVGKPEFTPPELQGRNLNDVNRRVSQDHFAFAVLVFKLLSEGGHFCDGVFHGAGDPPPLEARIASGAIPWRDQSGLWSPKPAAVPFASLDPHLQQLLVRAFETGHREPRLRPNAAEWQDGLRRAEATLRECSANPRHRYWGEHCTWCARTALLGGLDPFPAGRTRRSRARHRSVMPQAAVAPRPPVPPAAPVRPANPTTWSQELSRMLSAIAQEGQRAIEHFAKQLGVSVEVLGVAFLLIEMAAVLILILIFLAWCGAL